MRKVIEIKRLEKKSKELEIEANRVIKNNNELLERME